MFNRKLTYSILICLLLLNFIFAFIIFQINSTELKVIFFDVGQGDSILISEGSQQILIDGGKDGKMLLEKLGKYIPFWDRNIEAIIQTHPDQDHIGGLIEAIRKYKVDAVIKTNAESDSQTFRVLQNEIEERKIQQIEAIKDLNLILPGAEGKILFPLESLPHAVDQKSNDNSVVLKLIFGSNSFLFIGDLPLEMEQQLIGSGANLKSEVLKVGHHGSKYSTSSEFLDRTKPQDAIISVGKNNSYGHPNQEVLQKLLKSKANILRTDEVGDIVYECQSIDVKCRKE